MTSEFVDSAVRIPQSRSLSGFKGDGYSKGKGRFLQAAWLLTQSAVFSRWWCPNSVRLSLLRWFGADVGANVIVRHRVRIHWPWKLSIGESSWIGEGSWILNLEPISIGKDTCVSQAVLLCAGSHDRRSPTFEFDNAPIRVGDRVWIAARATVLRGVEIGDDATIGATALVASSVPAGATILAPIGKNSGTSDVV